MKDMIKKIREDREGFTLAELLIVVAIIAVLVAIAIPVFNSQLEKSREAVDESNIRAAYAECSASALTDTKSSGQVTLNDGTATMDVGLKQEVADWQGEAPEIGGVQLASTIAINQAVTVSVDKNGNVSFKQGQTSLGSASLSATTGGGSGSQGGSN